VLDDKKYLGQLMSMKLAAQTCPHCGSQTHSTGKNSFCNFCEQYIDIVAGENQGDRNSQVAFASVQVPMQAGRYNEAIKNAEILIKNNSDPRQLYLLAQFYLSTSGVKYRNRDYSLPGFMEANAQNIGSALDLTMKWKECYFKTVKIIGNELKNNIQVDSDLIFIKFMSEIRLQQLIDAANTLRMLQSMDKRGMLAEYALLVYSVEKNAKQAEASLGKALANEDANAFYYLAKYIARQKKLDDAEKILQKLSESTEIFMAHDLLSKVRSTQEASKM
jgi:tetratricopeptide (TPR) repeat protein